MPSPRPRILVVDNYDSFTFNLVQLLESLGAHCTVLQNDRYQAAGVSLQQFDALLISAGPCRPEQAGQCMEILAAWWGSRPILGVCLGHQAIAQHLGARLHRSRLLAHGKRCAIAHDGRGLFRKLPCPFYAARYNSLVVEQASVPDQLLVSAHNPDGEIMGLRHATEAIEGVQFHPESILSEYGAELFRNWLVGLRTAGRRRHG